MFEPVFRAEKAGFVILKERDSRIDIWIPTELIVVFAHARLLHKDNRGFCIAV